MMVFVQSEAGLNQKHFHDEKTLEYKGSKKLSRCYPYPYGFILNTTSGDGDNLDCFIITERTLKSGEVINCEPVGMMEVFHNAKHDHKILASLEGSKIRIDRNIEEVLRNFVNHAFDHLKTDSIFVGRFLGRDEAIAQIKSCLDV